MRESKASFYRRGNVDIISALLRLVIVTGVISSPYTLAQQVVVLGVMDIDFPPYQYIINKEQVGPEADVIRKAFSLMPEYKLGYKLLPVKRAIAELEWGSIDITTGFKTPEREKFAYFLNTALHWSGYKIAVLKGNEFVFDSIEDLYERDIAMMSGNKVSQEFDTAVRDGKIDIHYVDTFEDTVKMLTSNRVGSIVGNFTITQFYANKSGFSGKVTALPHPVSPPKAFRLMISKNSKLAEKEKLRQRLENVLTDMLKDGSFDSIYRKHGLIFDHSPAED